MSSIPLRLAPSDRFAAVRRFLAESDYTERAVCERLHVKSLHGLPTGKQHPSLPEVRDTLDLLIRLFCLGGSVKRTELGSLLPAAVRSGLEELGLVLCTGEDSETRYSPVALYPCADLHIVSDRWSNPDGSPFKAPGDVVYPAITKNTETFLRMLPSGHCRRLLDLCSGTGIAALKAAASQSAEHVWATDITERSTRFAGFNCLLNGVRNATVLTGDLYEAVEGLAFERIVAHPPYVPAFDRRWVFRDAGEDGEQVTRGIVMGLPRHLLPGGRLYCLALGLEREREPFEQRLRQWLGEEHTEFDILLIELETYAPERLASYPVLAGQRSFREFQEWKALFEKAGVTEFVYGLIVIQRQRSPREAFTVRRTAGPRSGSPQTEWLLEWETAAASPAMIPSLLDSRPVASGNFELVVTHRFQDGSLTPASFGLKTDYPFRMECKLLPWTAHLLANCDGTNTGQQLLEYCRKGEMIREEVSAEDFAGLLRSLAAGGFIEIEGLIPPAATE